MAKTSLIITSTDQLGKGLQKTVTDVNPDATSAQLVTFATKLNALTTNSYVRTDRVDKTNCDTEASGDTKPVPTLTLSKTTLTVSEIASGTAWTQITYDGDGDIYIGAINVPNATYQDSGCTFNFSAAQQQPALWVGRSGQATIAPCTFKVMTTETANYKAAEITVTITE